MEQLSRAEKNKRKRRCWKKRIEQWRQSGLSQAEYCRQHHLKDHQLSYWKRRFEKTESAVSFVSLPVGTSALAVNNPPLILSIDNHFKVEIRPGFDGHLLRQLIVVLQGLP
jgi:hypothetical protein